MNRQAKTPPCGHWSIAIFSSREHADTLQETVRAAIHASVGPTVIDVLVNGNAALAERLADMMLAIHDFAQDGIKLRIWDIPVADKAYTWNLYVHELWPNADTTFFIDGYARVMPDALRRIHAALAEADAKVFLASAVPSQGRSAKRLREQIIKERGIHGNLYALPKRAIDALRACSFRLPLGIYRTDPTLGAALIFGLDPARNDWDTGRVLVVPDASWSCASKSYFTPAAITTDLRRRVRVAQGTLENLAVREHLALERRPVDQLPESVSELVLNWLHRHPSEARWLFVQNPLCWFAARRLKRRVGSQPTVRSARMLFESPAGAGQ